MTESLAWAVPVAAGIAIVTVTVLRRASRQGIRRLLTLNAVIALGALAVLVALLFGVVDPAPASPSKAVVLPLEVPPVTPITPFGSSSSASIRARTPGCHEDLFESVEELVATGRRGLCTGPRDDSLSLA